MIEWEPALRPADLQHRLIRQVLKAWDTMPRQQRNVRRLVAWWTLVGSAQHLVKLEPGR